MNNPASKNADRRALGPALGFVGLALGAQQVIRRGDNAQVQGEQELGTGSCSGKLAMPSPQMRQDADQQSQGGKSQGRRAALAQLLVLPQVCRAPHHANRHKSRRRQQRQERQQAVHAVFAEYSKKSLWARIGCLAMVNISFFSRTVRYSG